MNKRTTLKTLFAGTVLALGSFAALAAVAPHLAAILCQLIDELDALPDAFADCTIELDEKLDPALFRMGK